MKLVSFGCSFIFGDDLADAHGYTDLKNDSRPSKNTWPALIAQRKNMPYSSRALAGIGNLRILESILTESSNVDTSFFIIGWSWIDRFDYTDLTDKWETARPTSESDAAENYYKHLHSQYRDKLTSLTYIRTAIDTLKQKGIPFLMTYMDDLLFETQWHCNPAIAELQEYIRPYLYTFDSKTFLKWSRDIGFPISERLHPLEAAHAAGADYMFPYVESKLIALKS